MIPESTTPRAGSSTDSIAATTCQLIKLCLAPYNHKRRRSYLAFNTRPEVCLFASQVHPTSLIASSSHCFLVR